MSEKLSVVDTIRVIGSEFDSITDNELTLWISICEPLVSKKVFGKLYETALAYLVCHKLKMAGKDADSADGVASSFGGSIAAGFTMSSVSDGGTSISFSGAAGNSGNVDAEYAMTVYGAQFLQLRRTVVVPIMMSGTHI